MDAIPASKPDATPVNDNPAPGPEQRPQPATSSITNVAAMAHVSIATVSRVLSGKRTKDDDIARRVRAAAEELNYSVNYAASSLRGAATNTIGLVIPSATDHFSAGLLDELEPVIDMERQQLLLGIGNEQHTQDERIESLVARKVDGIIIVPAVGVDLAHTLDRTTMTTPIVQVGGRQRSFRTSMVGIDENAAMEVSSRTSPSRACVPPPIWPARRYRSNRRDVRDVPYADAHAPARHRHLMEPIRRFDRGARLSVRVAHVRRLGCATARSGDMRR